MNYERRKRGEGERMKEGGVEKPTTKAFDIVYNRLRPLEFPGVCDGN
jgi:hypothetical protein